MKIEINSKKLSKVLDDLRSVVERRNTIPALSNVLIESVDGRLRFTATDLDNTLQIDIDAEHEGENLCVSFERLHGLVKALPEQEITINKLENAWAEIRSETGKFKIQGIERGIFPATEKAEGMSYECAGEDFLSGLSQVAHCIGEAEMNDNRALFELNGCLRFVATDHHSLALCEVHPEQAFLKSDVRWVLLDKAVKQLLSVLNDEEKITVWSNKSLVTFKQGNKTLSSRLPTEPFIAYERILTAKPSLEVKIDKEILGAALTVINAATENNYNREKAVKFVFDKESLTLTKITDDGEEATEVIDCQMSEGLTLGFNLNKLRPLVAHALDNPQFLIEKDKALWVISESGRVKSTQLLMPYRI